MSRPGRMSLIVAVALVACAQPDEGPGDGAEPGPAMYEPSADARAEVLEALQTVFDALGSGDAELLRSVMHPDVLMYYSETNARGETLSGTSTLDGLAERIQSSEEPLIERMWEPRVQVSSALATIWTPYDFYVGSEFSHCGVDAATLMKGDGGWTITSLSWTRLQPPACPLHPEGPPAS